MEDEERKDDDVVLQFVGYMDGWESVEGLALHNHITNTKGIRTIQPYKQASVIMIHPRVVVASTKHDCKTLKEMFKDRRLLRFKISIADEEDEIAYTAKKRLEKVL